MQTRIKIYSQKLSISLLSLAWPLQSSKADASPYLARLGVVGGLRVKRGPDRLEELQDLLRRRPLRPHIEGRAPAARESLRQAAEAPQGGHREDHIKKRNRYY